MTDLEEDNVVNIDDIKIAHCMEIEMNKIRAEFKKKCEELRDKDLIIRKALYERVCYLINISYLKNSRDGIVSPYKYNETKGTYPRYLKDEFVFINDGKYLKFHDSGDYIESDYIIPVDVIVSYNPEKDKKFADYITAFQEKNHLDYLKKQYDERKKDSDYFQQEYSKSKMKFDSLYDEIYNKYEWQLSLNDFMNFSTGD